jgi:phosphoglycerol transferase MdoB-like AlkP superfamily enzyme
MKFKLLPSSGKAIWQNNKPFIWFLLILLLIHSVLKIIFYQYNHQLLFNSAESGLSGVDKLKLVKWSLTADLLTLLGINSFLLFVLSPGRFVSKQISAWLILPLFVLINSLAIILNLIDIFYFSFHFQRANADLLLVLDHPVSRLIQQNYLVILAFVAGIVCIIYGMWLIHKRLHRSFIIGNNCRLITAVLFMCFVIFLIFRNRVSKFLVPTYPLIELKSNQLSVIQNSFHSFVYSVFRNGEGQGIKNYMSGAACDSIIPIRKKLITGSIQPGKKNIVLFIMESVPYDFFDSSGRYKVRMPFFDSLLKKSTFYNNAFCYAHESNKGITAILAGIPTLTDVPLYHSPYINMPITAIGRALKQMNYRSLFCIGDGYDNFGFAKCMNWLGIDKYYSEENIPNYKNLPKHSMGLQDENVINFFLQKINEVQKPFLAVQYNISTHFPYDIPKSFAKKSPFGYTAPMKAMQYYDFCLQQFFSRAKSESWFANTMFIFCSDHWLFPQGKLSLYTAVSAYRIPIIIYDPSVNKERIDNSLVSQFDIPGTILAGAGYRDSIISYGNNLFDTVSTLNNLVFSKAGNSIYQVIDSSYIAGFNIASQRAEYLYNYKKDINLKENLVNEKNSSPFLNSLVIKIKAFVQKANTQYHNNSFK